MKESITPKDVCNLLNELLAIDYEAVKNLVSSRVRCNQTLADHPTVQARQYQGDEYPSVGLIGILNGLFGIRPDGMGVMCYTQDDDGKITEFKETPNGWCPL